MSFCRTGNSLHHILHCWGRLLFCSTGSKLVREMASLFFARNLEGVGLQGDGTLGRVMVGGGRKSDGRGGGGGGMRSV